MSERDRKYNQSAKGKARKESYRVKHGDQIRWDNRQYYRRRQMAELDVMIKAAWSAARCAGIRRRKLLEPFGRLKALSGVALQTEHKALRAQKNTLLKAREADKRPE